MMENSLVKNQLEAVRERMEKACIAAGRSADEVQLLAVTKTVSPALINQAIACGVTAIGENRVQEYLGKKDELHLDGVHTHLIGHLQTNKVKSIVGQVDMIQSVDSVRLAEAIHKASVAAGICTDILIEVNIGREPQKAGVLPEMLEPLLECASQLSGIHVCGLMTIPPILETEREKRKIFSQMYQLFIDIRAKKLDNIDVHTLSMGMSGDYYEAILEGATTVRVGSAIFGQRLQK